MKLRQFPNLPECEFERGLDRRWPSGRRHCITLDMKCGIEKLADCRVRKRELARRREAAT